MEISNVFYIILLACASLLCLALIFYLSKITKTIRNIEGEIKDLSAEIKPLISSSMELSEKLNYITGETKNQINLIKATIGKVRDRVDTILSLEEKVREGFERPLMGLLKNLSALSNGINTFWKTFRQ